MIWYYQAGVNISHENRNYSVPDPKNFKTFPKFKKKFRWQITVIFVTFVGFLFFYKSISDKHEWLYSQYTVSSLEWTIKPKIIRKSRFFLIFFFKSSNCCTLFGKNFYFLTSQNKKLFWKYSEFRNYSDPFSVSLMRNIYPCFQH